MEFHEKLRIVAGILCLIASLLRVFLFFFDLPGAVVYSAIFVPWGEAMHIVEAAVWVLFAFLFAIAASGFAVLVYFVLGIMVIAGRRLNVVVIGCNIITGISIALSIRAMVLYAAIGEINIFLTILMIVYIVIFSFCLFSYIRIRKEG